MKPLVRRRVLGTCFTATVIALLLFSFREPLTARVIDHFTAEFIGPIPPFSHQASPTEALMLPMRDGVKLHTRIYRPEGAGPWPTLLVRDAYQFNRFLTCHYYVRFGFACVHQDVRGQGDSEGQWYPIRNETADGMDTLEWLTRQPWQDGNIGLIGGSYLGLTQWAVADRLPPEVKTMVPTTAHGDFYSMVYRGGHFAQAIAGLWSAEIFYPLSEKEAVAKQWREEVAGIQPANAVDPTLFRGAWQAYSDYLKYPDPESAYWQQDFYQQLRSSWKQLNVPILWIARWHDFFLEGMLEQYIALPTRDSSLLLIQPGEHAGRTNDLPYENHAYPEFSTSLAWLNHHLRGAALPEALQHRVVYYEHGADRWQGDESWPPKTQEIAMLLGDLAGAVNCGGRLVLESGQLESVPVSFVYQPTNPVTTRGGSFILNPNLGPVAVAEQGKEACNRSDILSFYSHELADALHIAGSIAVTLDVASDAHDSAFTVKLSEVFPDGRVLNIRDDISTLELAKPDTGYIPGERRQVRFQLVPIDWWLQKGSRFRLDISSSNFPAFPPHSNLPGLWSELTESRAAVQTVYSGVLSLPQAVRE